MLWDKFPNATSGTFLNGEQITGISEGKLKDYLMGICILLKRMNRD